MDLKSLTTDQLTAEIAALKAEAEAAAKIVRSTHAEINALRRRKTKEYSLYYEKAHQHVSAVTEQQRREGILNNVGR